MGVMAHGSKRGIRGHLRHSRSLNFRKIPGFCHDYVAPVLAEMT